MSENIQNTVSNQVILQAIQAMDHKFTAANDDILSAVSTSFTGVAVELHEIKEDIVDIKREIVGIKANMVTKEDLKKELVKVVTKEYLDDKLSDFKGDLIGLVRKEDHKVNTVVSILHDHKVLSGQDMEQIDQVRLFPKTTVV